MNKIIIIFSILLLSTSILLTFCSKQSYTNQANSLIKKIDFPGALEVLHKAPPEEQEDPAWHLANLELLTKIKGKYKVKNALQYEKYIKNDGFKLLKEIRTKLYSDNNTEFRFHMARIMNTLEYLTGKWQIIYEQAMIIGLESRYSWIRKEAIDAISNFQRKNKDGLLLLLSTGLQDSNAMVRMKTAEVLARRLNCETGYDTAKKALKNTEISTNILAARALGYMTGKKPVEDLKPLLKHENLELRLTAAGALINNSYQIDINFITKHLKSPVKLVKLASVNALGQSGISEMPSGLGILLKDHDHEIRFSTIQALNHIKDPKSLEFLLKALKNETDIDCKSLIIRTIGNIGHELSAPALIGLFSSDFEKYRQLAIIALGNIGRKIVPVVLDSLKSKNPAVQKHSMIFLAQAKDKRASQAVYRIFLDNDTDMAVLAAHVMSAIRDSLMIDSLAAQIDNPDRIRSLKAIQILGETGDKRALKYLTEISEPKEKRFQALAAIKKIEKRNKISQKDQKQETRP